MVSAVAAGKQLLQHVLSRGCSGFLWGHLEQLVPSSSTPLRALGAVSYTFPLSSRQVWPSLTQAVPEAPHLGRGLAGAAAHAVPGHLCPVCPVPAFWTEECQQFTHICPLLVLCLNDHMHRVHNLPMRSIAVK